MSKNKDFLSGKLRELAALDEQEAGAISLVERTVRNLRAIGNQSKQVLDEIDAHLAEVGQARDHAQRRMNHSNAIADNFEKLITVGE